MDGLRLALIVLGIVVVAVVYFWTARRRRMDREAGDFDRFDAWTDSNLDPLAPDIEHDRAPDTLAYDIDQASNQVSDYAAQRAQAADAWAETGSDDPTDVNVRARNVALGDVQEGIISGPRVISRRPAAAPSAMTSAIKKAESVQNKSAESAADSTDDGHALAGHGAASRGAEVMDPLLSIADSQADSSARRSEPKIGALDDIELNERTPTPTRSPPSAQTRSPTPTRNGRSSSPSASAPPARVAVQTSLPLDEVTPAATEDAKPQAGRAIRSDMVVVLNVMARSEQSFAGLELKDALERAGLKPGDMQLYDYRTETQSPSTPAIFSALNAVKPGTLDVNDFNSMKTPGIALIMRMDGLDRASESFELMLGAARRIAEELDGQVCDETRSTLTGQALNHLRERIADEAFRSRSEG